MNSIIASCLLIFFGRIIDVSLGTLRMLSTVKEKRFQAALYGFCEVFVWFIIVRDALNSSGPVMVLALSYAAGYACGTFAGSYLSNYLVPGSVTLEIITTNRSDTIPNALREQGYGISVLNVNESQFGEPKYLIIADVNKKRVPALRDSVIALDPGAFIMLRESMGHISGHARPGK